MPRTCHARRRRPGWLWVPTCALALALAIALGTRIVAQSPDGPPSELVVDVRIEGNRAISEARILREIKTRTGRPFSETTVEADVRQLAKQGWFVDVRPLYQKTDAGRIVIFRVSERPILRYIKYLGNQNIKDKTLAKQTDLKIGDSLDPYAVEEGRRKIEQFYKERGYNKVRVTIIEGSKLEDRGAVYVINEGDAQRVWHVNFEGNSIASDERLKTQIQSKPGILWLFKGYVDRKKIDEDVDRLTAYYRSLGYFGAKIGRELEFGESDKWLTITYVIDEGPRYKVRNVSFIGNRLVDSQRLTAIMELRPGEFFNQGEMNTDVNQLRDVYGSQGYVFADIKADPRFLEEPGTLDLVYNIDEGNQYRVGRINVHLGGIDGDGSPSKMATVLNRLSLQTGEIIDIRKLRDSERRLRASGLFNVNPASGEPPRIVFSPPGGDDADTQVARGHSRGKVRGQSPDDVSAIGGAIPHETRFGPSATGEPRTLDIHIVGRLNPAAATAMPPATPLVRMQSPDRRLAPPPVYAARPTFPVQQAANNQPLFTPPPVGPNPTAPAVAPQPGYGSIPTGQVGPADNFGRGTYIAPSPAGQTRMLGQPGPVGGGFTTYPQANFPSAHGVPDNSGPYEGPMNVVPEGLPVDVYQNQPAPYLNEVPLDIYVDPTQTGRFMLGVGVNSDAGVVGNITLDEQNFDIWRWPTSFQDFRDGRAFRGAGQRFRVEAQPGDQVQRYLISLQEPYLFDTNVSLGISGFFFDRNYRDWDEQRYGGRLSLGYQLTPDLSFSVAYRGEMINIHNPSLPAPPEVQQVLGDNELHGFKPTLRHDTRDSAFMATQGHFLELSYEQVLGSFDYPRAELDARQYFMMRQRPDGSGRHVLGLSGRVGFTGSQTPVYDRFFVGGFSTMRGYSFRGASPRATGSNVRVGGDFMMLGSAEYMVPITADDMLRAVAFVDAGVIEQDVEVNHVRVAPGIGLRITVPALGPAPIALDFAFPINSLDGDDEQIFSFNLGVMR